MSSVIDLHNFVDACLIFLIHYVYCNRFARLGPRGASVPHRVVRFPVDAGQTSYPSGGCKPLNRIVNRCMSVHELGGKRASFPVCALPVSVHIVHRDGLDVNAVPSERGIHRYACHVLGFDCRDRRSGARM